MINQIYAMEFLEHAARLIGASVYADYCDDPENEDHRLPTAGMGGDWMDVVPDVVPWWPFAVDVALTVSGLPHVAGIPELVARTIVHNTGLAWDPSNPQYDTLIHTPVPGGHYKNIIDFLASGFAHAMLGTGCGIQDWGWEWPMGIREALRSAYYEPSLLDVYDPQTYKEPGTC